MNIIWQTTPAPDVASVTRELTFGTRPHRSNPVLAPEERFRRHFFVRPKKEYIDQEAGEKYETNIVGNGSGYCFVSYWWLFLFGLSKTETGAKTAPWVPKLGYFDGRVPNLVPVWHSQRRGPAWSVICNCRYLIQLKLTSIFGSLRPATSLNLTPFPFFVIGSIRVNSA